MHTRFLEILCCPITGEPLELVDAQSRCNGMIESGTLRSACGRTYPIIRGIPRFVSHEQYAASFGFEWKRWPRLQFDSENIGRPMEGHTRRMWERITGASDDQVDGKTIVEFGCGPGRFLEVVRNKGGVAVGIDLSAAVESARQNFVDDANVLIVQGDLVCPPFRAGAFDGGYSIGVLHHTPAPGAGLSALARTVREAGWVGCCVYPRNDFYDFVSVRRFRKLHRLLSGVVGYRFALTYAWFAAYVLAPAFMTLRNWDWRRVVQYIEQNWLVVLRLKDPRWRVLDVFDAITPATATTHTADEVQEWMRRANCGNVRQTPWCPTSAAGVRLRDAVAAAA